MWKIKRRGWGEGTGGFGDLSCNQSCCIVQFGFVLLEYHLTSICLALFSSTGQDIHCPPILRKVWMFNQYDVTLPVCDACATMHTCISLPLRLPLHDITVLHCRVMKYHTHVVHLPSPQYHCFDVLCIVQYREESPKPTTALEYTYGRKSRGANIVSPPNTYTL